MKKVKEKRVFKTIKLIIILIVIVVAFYLIASSITRYTGLFVFNSLENCLKNQNIILYINSYDTKKTINNLQTSEYLIDIDIINCLNARDKCNSINSFPSWDINSKIINGDISIKELADFSGCENK